jgi:dihydrodipicolinate synthase/N-acetylneuraminate lyase
MMLRGVYPILLTPFDEHGAIDESSLRRLVRFELEDGIAGLGIGGFASEAYKLSDRERQRCAKIVADEVAGRVPLIIGMSPGSTEVAIEQANLYAALNPAALMNLPPSTMAYSERALVHHYVQLAEASPVPIMLQSAPQIQGYSGSALSDDALVMIAERAPNVKYFKIEGPGSAEHIATLYERLQGRVNMFGGVGGLAVREEWHAGAVGLLPGSGFNEHFVQAWRAWDTGDRLKSEDALRTVQPLVEAVSGHGHEFSLHARKYLLWRKGVIDHTTVRRPTVEVDRKALSEIGALADELGLRIAMS